LTISYAKNPLFANKIPCYTFTMTRSLTSKIIHLLSILFIVAVIFSASVYLTHYVTNDINAQLFIQQFGYIGVLLISFITGLSLISPVPAATFTPIFTAGGIPLFITISLAVVGTMFANFISYYIGRLGHDFTNTHYPKIQKKILGIYSERKELLPYLVFGFTAFIPIPDEIYLIPLGIIGVQIREFIIPLLLGTIFFQTMTALGFHNIFQIILN
jgi:uncharacterized membrane protein YdjX (TVP38/TMEM64 family)